VGTGWTGGRIGIDDGGMALVVNAAPITFSTDQTRLGWEAEKSPPSASSKSL